MAPAPAHILLAEGWGTEPAGGRQQTGKPAGWRLWLWLRLQPPASSLQPSAYGFAAAMGAGRCSTIRVCTDCTSLPSRAKTWMRLLPGHSGTSVSKVRRVLSPLFGRENTFFGGSLDSRFHTRT